MVNECRCFAQLDKAIKSSYVTLQINARLISVATNNRSEDVVIWFERASFDGCNNEFIRLALRRIKSCRVIRRLALQAYTLYIYKNTSIWQLLKNPDMSNLKWLFYENVISHAFALESTKSTGIWHILQTLYNALIIMMLMPSLCSYHLLMMCYNPLSPQAKCYWCVH